MSYSIEKQQNSKTNDWEFVVLDGSGVLVPPPNTFSTPAAAEARRAELEEAEKVLIAEWKAVPPTPGQRSHGSITAILGNILIQHIGLGRHVFHQRSEALAEVDVGEMVSIKDGEIEPPKPGPSLGR